MSVHSSPAATPAARKAVTLHRLREMLAAGDKIAMLTAYDASFARVLADAGVDCLLVGDSLGMVLQGHASTLPVSLDEIAYHTRCAARGAGGAWLIADMPFGSFHEGPSQAMRSAALLMAAGAQMVKIEGGGWTSETVRFLVERGVPVCAHLGLTPQSVHALGGFRVQGRDDDTAARLVRESRELADAGAAMLVLELMPSALAARVQADNPALITIGIGAGPDTAGQVLVLHDMLGISAAAGVRTPRFVRDFLAGGGSVAQAVAAYVAAVRDGSFPDRQLHTY